MCGFCLGEIFVVRENAPFGLCTGFLLEYRQLEFRRMIESNSLNSSCIAIWAFFGVRLSDGSQFSSTPISAEELNESDSELVKTTVRAIP